MKNAIARVLFHRADERAVSLPAAAVAVVTGALIVALQSSLLVVAQGREAPGAANAARTDGGARRLLCVHGTEAGEALPVRSGPGNQYQALGHFPTDACGIRTAGSCRGDWCEMALGDIHGWVDTRFVGIYELPASPGAEGAAAEPPSPGNDEVRRSAQPSAAATASRDPASGAATAPDGVHTPRGACVTGVARRDTLRIRNGPGAHFAEVGGIPPGDCGIERLGACRGAWCRVEWRGRVGWVNRSFLR